MRNKKKKWQNSWREQLSLKKKRKKKKQAIGGRNTIFFILNRIIVYIIMYDNIFIYDNNILLTTCRRSILNLSNDRWSAPPAVSSVTGSLLQHSRLCFVLFPPRCWSHNRIWWFHSSYNVLCVRVCIFCPILSLHSAFHYHHIHKETVK